MLWSLNLSGEGVSALSFYGDAKFEGKIFLEFFNLQSAVVAEFFAGGSGHQPFFGSPNLRSKSFQNFLLY